MVESLYLTCSVNKDCLKWKMIDVNWQIITERLFESLTFIKRVEFRWLIGPSSLQVELKLLLVSREILENVVVKVSISDLVM